MGKSSSKPKIPPKVPKKEQARKKSAVSSTLSWRQFGSLPNRSKTRIHKSKTEKSVDESKIPETTTTPILPDTSKNDIGHIEIKAWLKSLDLDKDESYYSDEVFKEFRGVEEILDFSEGQLKKLGVKISSHRARMTGSLILLRSKVNAKRGVQLRRHSSMVTYRATPASNHTTPEEEQDHKSLSGLDAVYEAVGSKSLNNIIMEPDPSMNPQDLKKVLEWELSLDTRDLRSHAWYHGAIPRARAADIVREEGGFLVRDCTSQPGNYVLTCKMKNQPLHFVINKVMQQENTVYQHVQYQFEEEAFDTVPDLITFYVGSGKSITVASGAKIQFPKTRMYPLSFYATKYPISALPSRMSAPRLPSKKQRSHSLTPAEINHHQRLSSMSSASGHHHHHHHHEKCNSADGVIQAGIMTRSAGSDKFSTHSLPRTSVGGGVKLSLSSSLTLGRGRELSTETVTEPPPKPSRLVRSVELKPADSDPGAGGIQRVTSYHASGSDSGNGSGDSALSSAACDNIPETTTHRSGVIIKNPRYTISASESSTTLKNFGEVDWVQVEQNILDQHQPTVEKSRIDLENFNTLLLPVSAENKPLEPKALRGIKMILQESGSRTLANHLTRTDLDVIFHDPEGGGGGGVVGSGIELCVLPYGHQFRMDLIERSECLKLLVAVTILTCGDELERTEMLNKWIEIAIDTKTALGNLFGFCGVMLGLCLPQVERLHTTWHTLRQKHTDAAFNFEAKLRPTLKNMNSCSNPQAPNTTIPHLLPLTLLLERNLEDFISSTATDQQNQVINTQDFGLGTLLKHLESARKYTDSKLFYERNAEIVLGEARLDELTTDLFRTEFQMKFLWGSRGAFSGAEERHSRFDQVLTALAEKYCNTTSNSEV